MTTTPRPKITYATLRADNEELHARYEAGLERARARLGAYHRNFVDGVERDGDGTFEVRSPIDTDIVVGTFARIVGLAAFVLWSVALLFALVRREPWVAAAFAAVLLLGLQTDVIGIHWLALAIWGGAGIAVSSRPPPVTEPAPAEGVAASAAVDA